MTFTPKYLTIIEQRRSLLSAQLTSIVSPHSRFVWEIGCGHGHFLTAYATAHPDRLCIGIDLIGERIERAVKKRNRAKLPNLHFLQAEARLFFDALPEGAAISAAFVLFPDPWPKLRHNKHRIIQPDFLAQLARHAGADCPLYFRTDFTPYFEAACDIVTSDPNWRLCDEPWPFEFATVFQQRAAHYHSLIARCKLPPVGANSTAGFNNLA